AGSLVNGHVASGRPDRSPPVDLDLLTLPIFQRALLTGALLAGLLGLLGVLVTARGLAYLGDGLSHAAFGGIALGMFLGLTSPRGCRGSGSDGSRARSSRCSPR